MKPLKKIFASVALALSMGVVGQAAAQAVNTQTEQACGERYYTADKTKILHSAISSRDLDCVERVIASGADVNARNDSGEPPLMRSVFSGHFEIFKVLLDKGADINATIDYSGPRRSTAFQGKTSALATAVYWNKPRFVKELLARNAAIDEEAVHQARKLDRQDMLDMFKAEQGQRAQKAFEREYIKALYAPLLIAPKAPDAPKQ